ncbi:DUF3078 domain-containing protein [Marinilabiliaceae bacterium JC017]|nr:DUF3078 domain-containing protein [Marinilabiliaceae bacterium JC017]
MKKTLGLLFLVFSLAVSAQEAGQDTVKYWNVGGTTSFTFNQVSLNNWSAGGKNSLAGTALLKSFFNYRKEKISWANTFDIGYGLTKQGTDNPIKTEDKLQLSSTFGYAAGKHWFYSAMLDFKTQMDKGYKDPPANEMLISEFMAPAYLTLSLGMDYKPSDNFSFYISPITSKTTFVLNDTLSNRGDYGVKPGDNTREEYGAYAKMIAKKAGLVKNVDFFTRLELFSSLTEKPENVDIDWEVAFNMKINDLLTAIVSFNMIYDDDIKYVNDAGEKEGPRVQLKQLFGFGLSYKFNN